MSPMIRAEDLGIPASFNAATYFVDRLVAEGRGAHVAIEYGDERITYGELGERVDRVASALRDRLDVRPEERVVMLLHDEPAFAYAFFAILKIGAVAVPLNTLLKPADYRFLLDDTRASVVIVGEALLPQLLSVAAGEHRRLRHVVVVGDVASSAQVRFADLLALGRPSFVAEPTSRDEPAFWLYSSGSTGAPKACVHLHHDMVVCARLFAQGTLGLRPGDRSFSVAKLFFAYGLGNGLYFPLSVGATTVLWPGPPTAANVYRIIEQHRPTLFYSVPTGYGMLLAHTREGSDFDLSSVRLAVSAGEALPPPLFERFKQRFDLEILDGIGSTEALHMFISNRPGAIRVGSSGQVVHGYEARILDGDGTPVGDGTIGNLWISGESVCAAYWNQHEKTRETIEGCWLRTGDKYTRDADGYFWYGGRADDMLKVGGQWVSPLEVESALLAHPDVLECGVVGQEDKDALVKPVAFVVLREGVDRSDGRAAELEQFVRTRLADYKRPRRVMFVAALPKTATGKIQRFRLREIAVQGGPATERS
jgi:benzoate-CoA ligase family protein